MRGRRISRSVCLAAAIVFAGLTPPVNAVRTAGDAPANPMTVHSGNMGSRMMHHIAVPQRLVGQAPRVPTGGICHDQLIVP
jgi:hypothetical protein